MPKGRALTLYWTKTGNTERVARRIHATLENARLKADLVPITEGLKIDYLDYNLVFIGAPVYGNLPPKEVIAFLERAKQRGVPILPCAPEKSGIGAVVFCTYAGGHTGINEAVPALKYMGQFLEHEGIRVIAEWAFLGSFPGAGDDYNTGGRCGPIHDRPNAQDLRDAESKVNGLLKHMSLVLPLG